MTKARDISSLIGSSGQIDNSKITLDVNEIPSLTTDKIPNLDAGKITTGTFADARISNSSVVQHSTPFDDNKLVNDISTLALRQASNENKSAYNTNSMYVDVFQDSTGITNLINSQRNNDEYVISGSSSTTNGIIPVSFGTPFVLNETSGSSLSASSAFDGVVNSSGIRGVNSSTDLFVGIDYGSSRVVNSVVVKSPSDLPFCRTTSNVASNQTLVWEGSNDGSSYSAIDNVASGTSSNASVSMTNSSNTSYRYHRIKIPPADSASDKQLSEIEFTGDYTTTTINATGSFENNAITAPSSVSSMGAIITYQDQAGTNALNTDIVLQLSADGGTNYSTATLTALPDFSTGIKMAKVNDLAVTAGTSLKYKLNFANQASGTKEARIRGVALQY